MVSLMNWKRKESSYPQRSEESPTLSFQRELNKFMESFFQGNLNLFEGTGGMFNPRLNLTDLGNEYRLTAELPGLTENDLELTFSQNTLTIKGEKKMEKEESEKNSYRSERVFGSFQRTIPFSEKINPDKINATMERGLLRVSIEKAEEAARETKKIPINAKETASIMPGKTQEPQPEAGVH